MVRQHGWDQFSDTEKIEALVEDVNTALDTAEDNEKRWEETTTEIKALSAVCKELRAEVFWLQGKAKKGRA